MNSGSRDPRSRIIAWRTVFDVPSGPGVKRSLSLVEENARRNLGNMWRGCMDKNRRVVKKKFASFIT
jgi:hypothetical protein